MSENIFSTKCQGDSLIAMPESSCISCRYSSEMLILSGISATWRFPFPNLRRHLSKCCRDWSCPILILSLSSMTVKNLQREIFFNYCAVVMLALVPLRMTMYVYIYIHSIVIFLCLYAVFLINIVEFYLLTPVEIGPSNASPG